jgi:hypothetical protein
MDFRNSAREGDDFFLDLGGAAEGGYDGLMERDAGPLRVTEPTS